MTLVKQQILGILNNKLLRKIATLLTNTLDLANALDFLERAWWIEVFTAQPNCTYYFGPFADLQEAQGAMPGYVEDLESESAQGIQAQVKLCKPNQLTIDHDIQEEITAVSK